MAFCGAIKNDSGYHHRYIPAKGKRFFLTYVVYRGLGLYGTPMLDIILLQASVYIAVDMLPVPGAQGITEAMYRAVF